MDNVQLIADSLFTGTMCFISNQGVTVKECNFDMTACTNVATNIAINMNGSHNRMYRNYIRGTSGNKVGIFYAGSTDLSDVDTLFYT